MIYVSSAVKNHQPAWQTSIDFFNHGIENVELSGGLYDENQLTNLKKLKDKINFQLHNYFPPPMQPFVLNLASLSADIVKKSLDHIEKALQFSIELNCPRYSFHGGFLIDPQISELGSKVKNREIYDRNEAIKIFLENINLLADRASILGVSLFIENNVLSQNNFIEFNGNPFLMVDANECYDIMIETPSNVNLLLDLAHLNVSSKTLKFDRNYFFRKCNDYIHAYHLSDNDGLHDNNKPVSNKSWFWKYLKYDLNYYSLEIYSKDIDELKKQFTLAKSIIEDNIIGN